MKLKNTVREFAVITFAIVKEAIQAHDEHINVISTEGVGTEFIFSLTKV